MKFKDPPIGSKWKILDNTKKLAWNVFFVITKIEGPIIHYDAYNEKNGYLEYSSHQDLFYWNTYCARIDVSVNDFLELL